MISERLLKLNLEHDSPTAEDFARLVYTSAIEVGRAKLAQMLGVDVLWVNDWVAAHKVWRDGKACVPGRVVSRGFDPWAPGWRPLYELMKCEARVRDEEVRVRDAEARARGCNTGRKP